MGERITATALPLIFPMVFDDVYDATLARMKNRFTTPYYTEEGGNIDKLIQIRAGEIEELSHVLEDVVAAHRLSEASQYSLDQWGVLLQLPRKTDEADNLYRARLLTQSLIRRRSATVQDMVSTCAGLLGVKTDQITFTDGTSPASFDLEAHLVDILAVGIVTNELTDMINDARAGGVNIAITMVGTFTYRGIGDASDATKGYNNILNDNSDGGLYSGMI